LRQVDIFIDANALLNVYQTKGDDINDLKSLMDLSRNGVINLVTTDIVIDEFYRNRDRVISEAVGQFNKGKIDLVYPSIVRHLQEYGELKRLESALRSSKKSLYEKLMQLISEDKLSIDKEISNYFESAKIISHSQQDIKAAVLRDQLGKDPGKPGQLGDHINWIMVLRECDKNDLCIVSEDGDYECRVNKGKLKRSLIEERSRDSFCDVFLATSIRQAISKYKEVVDEHERARISSAISALEHSHSFASTHMAIAALGEFRKFSEDDVVRILKAYIGNNQVGGISYDDDVAEFLSGLEEHIESSELKEKYSLICAEYLPPDEESDFF